MSNYRGCLSSCSYIKPQLREVRSRKATVVYHLVPTSNHNCSLLADSVRKLFIILFLHQTTTMEVARLALAGCLSSCSYIKPQHRWQSLFCKRVVYHLVPTSNHNDGASSYRGRVVVYHLVPTSNHNGNAKRNLKAQVVYHLVPTSNHNTSVSRPFTELVVYHLVPTSNHNSPCEVDEWSEVVYHLVPTSNHNPLW